jgi:hypothetical protein
LKNQQLFKNAVKAAKYHWEKLTSYSQFHSFYQSANVVSLGLAQSDHIKRLLLLISNPNLKTC